MTIVVKTNPEEQVDFGTIGIGQLFYFPERGYYIKTERFEYGNAVMLPSGKTDYVTPSCKVYPKTGTLLVD